MDGFFRLLSWCIQKSVEILLGLCILLYNLSSRRHNRSYEIDDKVILPVIVLICIISGYILSGYQLTFGGCFGWWCVVLASAAITDPPTNYTTKNDRHSENRNSENIRTENENTTNIPIRHNQYQQMQTTPKKFENNWCKVTYDGYTKSITCRDKKIIDGVQKEFITIENYGTNSVDIWLILAQYFNDQTTYQQLRATLSNVASIRESKVKAEPDQIQEQPTNHFRIVDVNIATEEELCTLPGVNRIQAKKIIQFRERERYFNSREDFFETMQIKEHFQKQMKIMVVVNPVENVAKKKSNKEIERTVDL